MHFNPLSPPPPGFQVCSLFVDSYSGSWVLLSFINGSGNPGKVLLGSVSMALFWDHTSKTSIWRNGGNIPVNKQKQASNQTKQNTYKWNKYSSSHNPAVLCKLVPSLSVSRPSRHFATLLYPTEIHDCFFLVCWDLTPAPPHCTSPSSFNVPAIHMPSPCCPCPLAPSCLGFHGS